MNYSRRSIHELFDTIVERLWSGIQARNWVDLILWCLLETIYACNSVCSVIIYIHCANCIDTIFQNCVGHPQTLKTWCLLNLLYCDMSYIDSTTKLRQSVKASGQLCDIQKVNGKQMVVLLFKFADPVSAYTHRMRKICVKIYRDTNLSWVCIICSLVLHAEISSKGSRWKVW